MTTINEAIYSRLSGAAGVSALVSSRIYPGLAPQGTPWPFVVYWRDSSDYLTTLDAQTSVAESKFTVLCYAETYLGAEALSAAVRAALVGWTATSGPQVQHCLIESDNARYVVVEGTDAPVWEIEHNYTIMHG